MAARESREAGRSPGQGANVNNTAKPAPLRVLVIEDEQAARAAMERFLAFCGYSVGSAATAREALEQAERRPPDVLVCDWKLNGVAARDAVPADGVATAARLQRRFGSEVILITAYRLGELKAEARKARVQVHAFYRKPLSLGSLARRSRGCPRAADGANFTIAAQKLQPAAANRYQKATPAPWHETCSIPGYRSRATGDIRMTGDPYGTVGPEPDPVKGTPRDAPVTEHAAEAAHEAVDRVADRVARAEGRVRDKAAAGEQHLRMKGAEARASTERIVDQVRQYAQENPLAAAGIAFAAGLVVSRMLSR